MRKSLMTDIYVCKFVSGTDDYGNSLTAYINPKKYEVNIQEDFTEVEFDTYGSEITGMIKIRTPKRYDISESDVIFLNPPKLRDKVEINGVEYDNYGVGDYTVISGKPSYFGVERMKNPIVIIAKKEK